MTTNSSSLMRLLDSKAPVILAGDYNVMPTDLEVYKPERWLNHALFGAEARKVVAGLKLKAGRMRCGSFIRMDPSGHFGTTNLTGGPRTKACGSIIFCSHRMWRRGSCMVA